MNVRVFVKVLMALLIDRHALGRTDGIIAADLSDKMNLMQAEQKYAEDDGAFDLNHIRLWIDEYSTLAARGGETRGIRTVDHPVAHSRGACRDAPLQSGS